MTKPRLSIGSSRPEDTIAIVEGKLSDGLLACSELIVAEANKSPVDRAPVDKIKEGIRKTAEASKCAVEYAATVCLARILECMNKEPVFTAEMLASLLFSQEILDTAIVSVSQEHYDETDVRLIDDIKKLINLERGIGPKPGETFDWATGMLSVAMKNAVNFANLMMTIDQQLMKDDPEGKEKMAYLVQLVTEAILKETSEGIPASLLELFKKHYFGILLLWGLFLEGIKAGLFMGWRSHEVAIVKRTSPVEPEEGA